MSGGEKFKLQLEKIRRKWRCVPKAESSKDPEWNGWRIFRALSWLEDAEKDDPPCLPHVRFVLFWISFNALFGKARDILGQSGRGSMDSFLGNVAKKNPNRVLRALIFHRKSAEVLLRLLPAYDKYWRAQYLTKEHDEWNETRKLFYKQKCKVLDCINSENTKELTEALKILFSRLYVVRNQSMHGAALKGSHFIAHINTGINLLEELLPIFIEIVIDSIDDPIWGKIPYPRTGSPDHPGPPPKRFKDKT